MDDAGTGRIAERTRLLVVAPHPDDETLAAGLLLQRVRAAGGSADVLLLTDGDNNPWPQRVLERRVRIDAAARARLGRRRRAEMLEAMRRLGLPPDCLHALGWPDQGVTALALAESRLAVQTLAAVISRVRPDLIVLPALEDRHPDHGSAHVLVRLALAGLEVRPVLWTYVVHARQRSRAAVEIRGGGTAQAVKRSALAAHASQLALAPERLWRHAAGAECFAHVIAPSDRCPILPWRPPRCFGPWLRLGAVGAGWAQSWSWRDAPLRRNRDGAWELDARALGGRVPRFVRLDGALRSPWIFDHWGWCEPAPPPVPRA